MANWSPENIMLTKKGQELLSKVQAGVGQLTITRVTTGSTRVNNSNLYTLDKINDRQVMSVLSVDTTESGSKLALQVSNTDIDFTYRLCQIGVYASHPDMGEILYMIAQCDSGTEDTIPLPSVTPVILNYSFYLLHGALSELNITIDPEGFVTSQMWNEHLEDFQELCDFVGYNDSEIYGVEVDFENNTAKRIGANEGLKPSDFDNILPWGGRRRCNVTDSGAVVAYYGDESYSETGELAKETKAYNGSTYPAGTKVQVMVEQPKFWYKTVPLKMSKIASPNDTSQVIKTTGYSILKARYYISPTPRVGFSVFPLFLKGNPAKEVDYAYLAAYSGSLYDVPFDEKTQKFIEPTPTVLKLSMMNGYAGSGITKSGNITLLFDNGNSESYSIPVEVGESEESIASKIKSIDFKEWDVTSDEKYPDKVLVFTCKYIGARRSIEVRDTDETGFGNFTSTVESATGGNEPGTTKSHQSEGGYIRYDLPGAPYRKELYDIDPTDDMPVGVSYKNDVLGLYEPNFNKIEVSETGIITSAPMISSIAGVQPTSCNEFGGYRNDFSNLCRNRNFDFEKKKYRFSEGFGWQPIDVTALQCSIWLHLIEYATFNCKETIGLGVSSYNTSAANYNDSLVNGFTSPLGNASGKAPDGIDGKCSVSYRGEENLWGNINYYEDGVIYVDENRHKTPYLNPYGLPYTVNEGIKIDELPYFVASNLSIGGTGYISRLGYSKNVDWFFVPTECKGVNTGVISAYHNGQSGGEKHYDLSLMYASNNIGQRASFLSRNTNVHPINKTNYRVGTRLLFIPEPYPYYEEGNDYGDI